MNILSNTRVYLCGQIENDPEAAGWRKELARRLPSINPDIVVWDPMDKPEWALETMNEEVAFAWKQHVLDDELVVTDKEALQQPEVLRQPKLVQTGPNSMVWDQSTKGRECFNGNVAVRRVCKQLASKCDWFIARISKTFTWGSIDELEIAIARRIPIFLWIPDGIISIYGIAGCVYNYDHIDHYVHRDIDSMLRSISKIDSGQTELPEADPETWMLRTWKDATTTDDG